MLQWYDRLRAAKLTPTESIFTTMATYFANAKVKHAFPLMVQEMRSCGLKPSVDFYTLRMQMLRQLGGPDNIKDLQSCLFEMESCGMNPDANHYAILLDGLRSLESREGSV